MPLFPVSETTQKILKNFAGMSDSILLREGRHQKIVNEGKSVFALSDFPEAWPRETGIYSLGMFLGNLSLFPKPTIEFQNEAMIITNADPSVLSICYRYSDASTIMAIGDKTFPKNNPAVEFTLSDFALSQAKRAALQNKLETLNITAKGPNHYNGEQGSGSVTLTAVDAKNSSSHALKLTIPPSDVVWHDKDFARVIPFKVEHLGLLLDGGYTIALSDWRYAYATHKVLPVSYYVTEQTKD